VGIKYCVSYNIEICKETRNVRKIFNLSTSVNYQPGQCIGFGPEYSHFDSWLWREIFRRVRKVTKIDSKHRLICLSVRMEQLGSHLKDFHEILYLVIEILKFFRENSNSSKTVQEWQVLYMETKVHLWLYIAVFFLERETLQRNL